MTTALATKNSLLDVEQRNLELADKVQRLQEVHDHCWVNHPCLSEGFVCLVDVMGSDQAVVQAARVSYGAGTKKVSDDRGLIRYLMRNYHTTPYEMAEVKLLVKVPMDAWRQWIRHRTANVNEYSTRYSIAIEECDTTDPNEWRYQSGSNRQGSSGDFLPVEVGQTLSQTERELQTTAKQVYEERVELGVAREQARKDLPLSQYTLAYWKVDLHNLFHFLRLRMDSHAQKEIRDYAVAIGEKIIKPLFPLSWEAFVDYRLESMQLTRLDVRIVQAMAEAPRFDRDRIAAAHEAMPREWQTAKRSRERNECLDKLLRLKLITPEERSDSMWVPV